MADSVKRQASSASVTSTDNQAIYYDVSPNITFFVRFLNAAVLIMVLVGFALSIVQASEETAYYLLTANLGLSSIVAIVVNWWYRGGDLPVERYWFVIVIGLVVIFQCIMTDIFVYHEIPATAPVTTTVAPINTTTGATMITIKNVTNKSLHYMVTKPTILYKLN